MWFRISWVLSLRWTIALVLGFGRELEWYGMDSLIRIGLAARGLGSSNVSSLKEVFS